MAGLTHKQEQFVLAYLGEANGNATEAARIAGYAKPGQQGYENLKKPEIQERIREFLRERAMSAEEVLARLTDHARASLGDFIDISPGGAGWTLNLEKAKQDGKLHLLQELTKTEFGPKLKLVDSQSALVQLGRYHQLFTDKHEHSGPGGGPIETKQTTDLSGLSVAELQQLERILAKTAGAGGSPGGTGAP